MATGGLYHQAALSVPSTNVFDIRNALPVGFKLRVDINHILNVAPLPPDLQRHIEQRSTGQYKKDDIYLFLSQEHLSYLYTEFLGPRGKADSKGKGVADSKSGNGHPVWSLCTEIIRETSSKHQLNNCVDGMSLLVQDGGNTFRPPSSPSLQRRW